MTFEELIQPGTASVLGGAISAMVGLNGLFIRWLVKSFDGLRADMKQSSSEYNGWLRNHEVMDQNRHEENLYRFEKISVALARMGSTNGTHNKGAL